MGTVEFSIIGRDRRKKPVGFRVQNGERVAEVWRGFRCWMIAPGGTANQTAATIERATWEGAMAEARAVVARP